MFENRVVLNLLVTDESPRNSEGAFASLADGSTLYAWSRYQGNDPDDCSPAVIAARTSPDEVCTWPDDTIREVVGREGRCNVMSVSLLRLADGRLAMFYIRKESFLDCRPRMRISTDEGRTWSEPSLCIAAPGYFVVNNDRIIQLKSGRLLIPAGYHRARSTSLEVSDYGQLDFRALAMFFYSDDAGQSWKEAPDWLALPLPNQMGLQEPGVVELKDGRILGYARTDTGTHWRFISDDGGLHWHSLEAWQAFPAPCSPLCIKRIPKTGDLLAIWNDTSIDIGAQASSWGRTPLTAAISRDDGETWSKSKLVEDDPRRGYCYTTIHFTRDDAVLLAYQSGGVDISVLAELTIRRIALDWFYA